MNIGNPEQAETQSFAVTDAITDGLQWLEADQKPEGFWAGMPPYPNTKCTPQRAVDILEMYGNERLWMNSAGDWGPSDPFTLQECILEFRRRGHTLQEAVDVFHNNPARFLGQNPKFDLRPIRIEALDEQ